MQDFNQAYAYVATLAGDPTTAVLDWRAIHDTQADVFAVNIRGTLYEVWERLTSLNSQGFGVFAVVAITDGIGRKLENITWLRANYADLDNVSAGQNYANAAASIPAPSFVVFTSPGKYHVYWTTQPYHGNDRFQALQRRIRQQYDGDGKVIDAARVMRVPGFYHMKNPAAPYLSTWAALGGYGQYHPVEALEAAYGHINVTAHTGGRKPLGDPDLAGPSVELLQAALDLSDPNLMDRGQWIAYTAAFKQAAWSVVGPDAAFMMWSAWCGKYDQDNPGENLKQWRDIRDTELGWKSLVSRSPMLQAKLVFDGHTYTIPEPVAPGETPAAAVAVPTLTISSAVLTPDEQAEWFKGYVFVTTRDAILSPSGRFLKPGTFNVERGGKHFIIDQHGKTTDEAWKAATRSTLWQIPSVDHTRFFPHEPHGKIIVDDMGRSGVNVFRPANVVVKPGDPSLFLRHMELLLPDYGDRETVMRYLAHNVRFPGHKIPWAPLIQSAEGAGKGPLKLIMSHIMGKSYVYFPKATELASSGAQFNGWMRHKLFILVDEVKVDDRQDLIEVLKPMISEETIEVQSKGVDQQLEDNFSNWLFFTNHKNAVPITKGSRRWSINFSPLQMPEDMIAAGMDDAYFNRLYTWLKEGDGAAIVAHWLMNYPVERGALPMRAPDTTSTTEALLLSRGPVERTIAEAIDEGAQGFRGGWVSALAVAKRIKELQVVKTSVQPSTIERILRELGYMDCGRAPKAFVTESATVKPLLFYKGAVADVNLYGPAQGYVV